MKRRDIVLLVLGQRPEGLTVPEIHEFVAAAELRVLRDPKMRRYLEYSFRPSRLGVYSPGVAISLSELLKEGLVRPAPGNRLALTERGQAIANEIAGGTLGQTIGELTVDDKLKAVLTRELVHLEEINLRPNRAHQSASSVTGERRKLRGSPSAQGTKAGGKAELVTAGSH